MSAAPKLSVIHRTRMAGQNNVDPHQPVCIGLFRGDVFTHEVFAANRRSDAIRKANKLRAQGTTTSLTWLNVGPWCAEMWIGDLGRDLTIAPDEFYGTLDGAVGEVHESTGTYRKPR